jgi:hypothetical protein
VGVFAKTFSSPAKKNVSRDVDSYNTNPLPSFHLTQGWVANQASFLGFVKWKKFH